MELTPVACSNCGAPLQIPPAAQYVTCQHCSTQLEVKRNDSVAWTVKQQQLESIDRRTEQLVDEVAHLRYHSELNHVHRAWEREEQRYMVRDKYGNTHRPSATGSAIAAGGIVLVGIGLVGIGLMTAGDKTGAVVGVFMMIIGGVSGYYGNQRAIKYQQARRRYRRRCNEVRLDDYRLDLEEQPEQLSGNPFSFLPPPPGTGPELTTEE